MVGRYAIVPKHADAHGQARHVVSTKLRLAKSFIGTSGFFALFDDDEQDPAIAETDEQMIIGDPHA